MKIYLIHNAEAEDLDLSQKPPPTLRTIHAFKQYSGK
jgi:hypothetical protein